MHYFLRNQDRIKEEYGEEILERIIDSLDLHFKINMILRDLHEVPGEPYPIFIISDVGHTVNDIAFYRIKFEGGLHRLAFKEFIG
jgi:hypothetical protein